MAFFMTVCTLYSIELQDDWSIGKDLEGSWYGLIKVLSWQLSKQTKEDHELRIAGVAAKILTSRLLNSSL
jgi:hypothetical protein